VCPRCTTPSGSVPGGGAVGHLCCIRRRSGAGARRRGPGGVSVLLSWVLSANCIGPHCNFLFYKVLLVKCTPPTE
jgi:hypothetical protein